MHKWFILAASCLAFLSASAEEAGDATVASEEVTVDEGCDDVSPPPSLFDCGCKKGKTK